MIKNHSNNRAGRAAERSSSAIREFIVEALAGRREQLRDDGAPARSSTAVQTDRESLRSAIAVLFQLPMADVTDDFLEEVVRRVIAEAETDAERVAGYLDQLISQLEALNCVGRQEVFEYFAATDRVLLELYTELRQPRPSSTRLQQLIVQYALDARRRVDALAHQIEIRPRDEGYEVAIAAGGQPLLRSIPHPGVAVRNPFARRLIEIGLQEPPRYTELMQFIEMLLGYVPEHDRAIQRLEPITPATAVQVDIEESCIIVFGRCYVVDLQLAQFMKVLLETPGAWVSSPTFAEDSLFRGVLLDRPWKKLPAAVRDLIESRTGKGYRLRLERLETLCQISSVAK